jgi:chlorite dismutase
LLHDQINAMSDSLTSLNPILPTEGRHVLHLFYSMEQEPWSYLEAADRRKRRDGLAKIVRDIQALPDTQLLPYSVVGPKADLGFMLVTPDLQDADRCSKLLGEGLGAGMLTPAFSWLSMTERSEYTTSEAEYSAELKAEGIDPETPEFASKIAEFHDRMEKYMRRRVVPELPDAQEWPVFCFYPMSKRRLPQLNWYALPFEDRKRLMAGHAKIGRTYSGRVLQLITGSTGLDDMEWGVTLFAKTTSEIKAIVYEMRFDVVSSHYAEFGEFFIGIRMDIPDLCNRLNL